MTFIEYVEKVDHLIVEYTQKLSKETLDEIEKTIEDAISDLVEAFKSKRLVNTFVDNKFSNIKKMKEINFE